MTTIVEIPRIGQTIVLCACLSAASLAWPAGCPEVAEATAAVAPTAADELQGDTIPSEWYEFFHDASLHEPDGMGDYVQNYQAAYPD